MNFLEIQDAVKLDRFSETQRAAIKFAINSRYGRVWAMEPWTFKRTVVTATVLANSHIVSLESLGLQDVISMYFQQTTDRPYEELLNIRPEDWIETYGGLPNASPAAFTIQGGLIRTRTNAPTNVDRVFSVLGDLAWVPLEDDTDVPLLPLEYHGMLVAGAAADMLLREADPTWQGEQQAFNDQVNEMKQTYLSSQPMSRSAYPAWP